MARFVWIHDLPGVVDCEYIDGSGQFTGFLSLFWPNGDAVVFRYEAVVVRDDVGDSRWNSILHVINGARGEGQVRA